MLDGIIATRVDFDLSRVIAANRDSHVSEQFIDRLQASGGRERTRWLSIAGTAEVIGDVPAPVLISAITDDDPERLFLHSRLTLLAHSRPSLLGQSDELMEAAVSGMLSGAIQGVEMSFRGPFTWIDYFMALLSPDEATARIAGRAWQVAHSKEALLLSDVENDPDLSPKLKIFLEKATGLETVTSAEWQSSLVPWSKWVEAIRSTYGESWTGYEIAGLSAQIKSVSERGAGCHQLFDHSKPLCHRARYARLRRSSDRWWVSQLAAAPNTTGRAFWILMHLRWASSTSVQDNLGVYDDILQQLTLSEYDALHWAMRRAVWDRTRARDDFQKLPNGIGARSTGLLTLRYDIDLDSRRTDLLLNCDDECLRNLALRSKAAASLGNGIHPRRWKQQLELIRQCVVEGALPHLQWLGQGYTPNADTMPAAAAEQIIEAPLAYPFNLVALAESTLASGRQTVSVASTAEVDGWSFD